MQSQDRLLQFVARTAAAIIALGALLVLVGWSVGIPVLKCLVPGLVAMNPTTAALFLMTAACLAVASVSDKGILLTLSGQLLGAVVCLVGGAVVSGYLLERDTGIDTVLFTNSLAGNRMAPVTAASFFLLGLTYTVTESSRIGRYMRQGLALVVFAGAIFTLLGYGFDAKMLYRVDRHIPMAVNTAILFLLSAVALLGTVGEQGILTVFIGSKPGSVLLRRLFPMAVIGPVVLGFLRISGQRAGWYGTEFGAAMMVVMTVVLLATSVLFTARTLNRNEGDRLAMIDVLRQSHETLNSRTLLLEAILTSMEDGVVVADEHGKCVQFNPAAERILDKSLRDVELEQWSEHFGLYQSDGKMLYAPENLSITRICQGLVATEEELILRKEPVEDSIWLSISGHPLRSSDGELRGGVVMLRDITERKQVETALRQHHEELEYQVGERTYELSEANIELSQKNQENELFIYSVSHDLRSPLVNLQGFSRELGLVANDLKVLLESDDVPESIRTKGVALLEGDMEQSLHFIETAVSRLGNIIDALLMLSRVGRVEYQWKPIDLESLVVRVIESMQSTLDEADIQPRLGELPPCYGDETALEQLFANLIGNAVKYRDPTRPGVIEIGVMAPSTLDDDSMARTYFVRDNGLGIPAPHQEKIFQAFKRAHPNVAPGDGMGLAIVRRTVERHGGKIRLESQEGQGSTFVITLPSQAPLRTSQKGRSNSFIGEIEHGDGTHDCLVSGRR